VAPASHDFSKTLVSAIMMGADVAPEQVAAFLEERVRIRDLDVRDAFFAQEALWSLCRQSPDLAASLTERLLCERLNSCASDRFVMDRSAIHDPVGAFFPPTPYKGPFWPLLRTKPETGVPLIIRLTDHGTKAWLLSHREGPLDSARKPLPLRLVVGGDHKDFWGDGTVYGWFRCNSVGPYPVCCALMALEQWLLRRIESGEPAGPIMEGALAQSESVAMIGTLVSVGLAHPEACAEALLPILCCPAFWRMDLHRMIQDRTADSILDIHRVTGRDQLDVEVLEKVIAQTHRRATIEEMACRLIFSGHEMGSLILEAARRFPEQPHFSFADDDTPQAREEWRQTFDIVRARVDPANYCVKATDDPARVALEYIPPPSHQALLDARRAQDELWRDIWTLRSWGYSYLVEDHRRDELGLEQAASLAARLADTRIEETDDTAEFMEKQRRDAVALVAAGLIVRDAEWAERNGWVDWCRGQVLRIVAGPRSPLDREVAETVFTEGADRSAARAVPLLLSVNPDDEELREALWWLLAHATHEVRLLAFDAARCLWSADSNLAWDVIAFGIGTARRRRYDWVQHKMCDEFISWVEAARRLLLRGRHLRLERLRGVDWQGVDYVTLRGVVLAMPQLIGPDCDEQTERLLSVIEDMLRFQADLETARAAANGTWGYPHILRWRGQLFEVVSCALLALPPEKVNPLLLQPVMGNWQRAPSLLADLLTGLVHITSGHAEYEPRFVQLWRNLVPGALDSPFWAAWKGSHHDLEDLVAALLCVPRWRTWHTERWEPLGQLTDVITHWVEKLGASEWNLPYLVRMLSGPGLFLFAEHGIHWLDTCRSAATSIDRLLGRHGRGDDLASLLEQGWRRQEGALRSDPVRWRHFTGLVDGVAALGEPIALRLQQEVAANE